MERARRPGDRDDEGLEGHPPIPCWFCERRNSLGALLSNCILIAREDRLGGPYRLSVCPDCFKETLLEATPRGRWFGSPNVRLGILDYLFARGGAGSDGDSEVILKAISWFRDNEERRRYHFERDGDRRYSGASFLRKLWPWGKEEPARPRRRPEERPRPSARAGEAAGGARAADGGSRAGAPQKPRLLSPHEILGVDPGATVAEIQRRFHRLAVQYHPDKVHHLGAEFEAEAHRRFIRLQEAYLTLMTRQR